MIKVDLHVHTYRSPDSLALPEDILRWARRRGIDRVAVTDHNALDVALEMRRRWPQAVLVGEEIKSTQGEIIGLFLEEEIPAGLSPRETVAFAARVAWCTCPTRWTAYVPPRWPATP